ncbi:MAG: ABC transporter ATP-binding protein [Candidatus Omnitrophica bacterium]|nr:ABC transporter ATP-binding protein [Candidatus Omnitrophota bacterium]
MSGAVLELRHVAKRFPSRAGPLRRVVGFVQAVSDVSLTIQPGEMVGLVGESGCGKTTLAKLITQLEPVTSGEILFQGRALANGRRMAPSIRRQIQLVFQDPTGSLNPRQRVGAMLGEPLLVHRVIRSEADRRGRVQQLLEQVGLPASYLRRYPRELSGGERQRVAIARALALDPSLLILDEPVASLDVYVGSQILELLRRLHAERRLSYLVISHDLRVIGSLCDRIAVMYLGRIVERAPAAQLFRAPLHPYTELLLESAGLRQAGVEDRGELPSPLHPPSGCAFRTRCPLAAARCAEEEPALLEKQPGRLVACHFRP